MAFTNAGTLPYTISPLTNITPFTYADGVTYLEKLELMRVWLNETLVPDFNAGIQNAINEYQAGLGNAEEYVDNAVQFINNKTGQAQIQRTVLTGPHTVTVDPLWPNNHPINIVLTQNIVGGHTVTWGSGINGAFVTPNTLPNTETDFWLVPEGNGNWTAIQYVSRDTLDAQITILTDALATKANASALGTTNTNVTNLTATVTGLSTSKANATDVTNSLAKKAGIVNTLPELLAAVALGGTVRVGDAPITVTERVNITVPTKIIGGHFILPTSAGFPVFQITSSDVAIDGARFVGSGTSQAYEVGTRFVWASGTTSAYLSNVNVLNCNMDGCQSENIRFTCVRDSRIEGNYIDDFLYAGVMLMSCEDMTVASNTITNAVMKAPVVNVYGIAATDSTNNDENRSRRIKIIGNTVRSIPWEGIDTHGGEAIVINGNTLTGCSRGIALVAGNESRTIVPIDCVVSGNLVSLGNAADTTLEGIGLHGTSTIKAGATITGNKVRGYGADKGIYTNNIANTSTLIEGNSQPHLNWTPLTMSNPTNWVANSVEPPEYMIDGRTVYFRGIITPGTTQATGNTLIGTISHLGARPENLTMPRNLKGGNQAALGQGVLGVYANGDVYFLYRNNTTDGYNYAIDCSYQRNYTG